MMKSMLWSVTTRVFGMVYKAVDRIEEFVTEDVDPQVLTGAFLITDLLMGMEYENIIAVCRDQHEQVVAICSFYDFNIPRLDSIDMEFVGKALMTTDVAFIDLYDGRDRSVRLRRSDHNESVTRGTKLTVSQNIRLV